MLRILFAFLLVSSVAQAASLDALVGAGVGKNILAQHAPFERFGTLGIRYGGAWKIQANGGYYLALAEGERSAWMGSLQTGLEVVGDGGTYGQLMFGPAYVSQDDSKLSGRFQFHLTGGVGVKNDDGYGIGVMWNHLSNAGIKQPNMGRDMITAQLTIPIWRPKK